MLRIGATKHFFFDRQKVIAATTKAERKFLSRAGAYVRRGARSSIRKARRKQLGEMTPDERRRHYIATALWEREGRKGPRPKRPFAHSKAGEPPRSIEGSLRKHVQFGFDAGSRSVLVGPERLNGTTGEVPHVLEYGGSVWSRRFRTSVVILPRPFMRPALERERPKFPELWRNSIRAG